MKLVFHPAKEHPKKAAALGFVLGIAFQALWQMVEPWSAVLLAGLLVMTVRDFYLETEYSFDEEGIAVRGFLKAGKSYPWRRFRAFVEDRNGLFLSPYKAVRRLDQQRGVFLPMTREQRLSAVEYCQERQLVRRTA